MVAHMTPGEIAVPPQIQTPDVLTTLNKAFSEAGANPTSYQVGSPDQKVNPETGMPEFGFFDFILPAALGLAGTAIGGPLVGAGLGSLGVGAGTAALLGPAIGGAIGSTVGNVATGRPLGQSLAMGALGGAGSAAGGALLGGAGAGASPAAETASGGALLGTKSYLAASPAQQVAADVAAEEAPAANAAGAKMLADAGINATPAFDWKDMFTKALGLDNPKRLVGETLGGAIGSTLGEGLFPSTYRPPSPSLAGGTSPSLYQPRSASVFPTPDQLRNYGRGPQFNFYPV
jgi:hypothetical protein